MTRFRIAFSKRFKDVTLASILRLNFNLSSCNSTSKTVSAYLRDSDKSLLISDLIGSFGEIVRFVNDRALESVGKHLEDIERGKIEQLLGLLEVGEVFLEIAAFFVGGHIAKWIVIIIIQTLK